MTEQRVEPRGLDEWEGLGPGELADRWGVPEVRLFASVGSTNDVARDLAASGASPGCVVVAEEQLRGRGRVGRAWASPPGLGLWFSTFARPGQAVLDTLPVRVGLMLSIALDPWTEPGRAFVKWPNDLLLEGRKLGGILCEGAWAGDRLEHIVIGVGLNLLQAREDFPPDVQASAISLTEGTGVRVRRLEVADAVVPAVVEAARHPADDLVHDLRHFAMRDELLGKWLEVVEPESGRTIMAGEGVGIDRSGALLVRTAAGRRAVRSGTVRVRNSGE